MASTSSSLDANRTINAFLTEIEAPLRTFVSQGSFKKWRCKELIRSNVRSSHVLDHITELETRIPACFDSEEAERPNFLLEGLEDAIQDDKPRFIRFGTLFKAGDHSLLLNTSGSGKTRTCFEALTQLWGCYFVFPSSGDKMGSKDLQSAMGLLDAKGNDFTPEIPSPPQKPITARARTLLEKNRQIAGSLFSRLLLARLLILKLFLRLTQEDKPKDVPIQTYMRRWLLLQLQPTLPELPDIPDLFDGFFSRIRTIELREEELEEGIRSTMRTILFAISSLQVGNGAKDQKSLFIIIDEAQVGSRSHPKAFRCSGLGESNERPALRELVSVWRRVCLLSRSVDSPEAVTIILTGTGLCKEEIEEALSSATMKKLKVAEFNMLGAFDDRRAQEQYVRNYIPQCILEHEVGKVLLDRMWHWLRGRYRFTAEYLTVLIENGFQQPNKLLNLCINDFAGFQPSDCPQEIADLEEKLWPLHNSEPRISFGKPDWSRLGQLPTEERMEVVTHCYTYLLTTENKALLGSSDQELLQYGFARIPGHSNRQDDNRTTPVMDERLILCACAVWFNNNDEGSKSSLYRWISKNITHTAADGQNFFEFFLAFYFVLAFGDGSRRIGDVFRLHEVTKRNDMVPLEKRKATLVSMYSPEGGPINRDCKIRFDQNGKILSIPGPIGFRTGSNAGYHLTTWLDHQGREALCFPDMAMGPDILFVLRLEGPVEYLWVAVQCKLHGGYYTASEDFKLDSDRIRGAMKSVTPKTFFGRLREVPDGADVKDTESLPLLNDSVCSRLKKLERRDMTTAGECSLLRVVASWPAVTEFDRCKAPPGGSKVYQEYEFPFRKLGANDKWHPLASLNTDTLLKLTGRLKPDHILENYRKRLIAQDAEKAQLKNNRSATKQPEQKTNTASRKKSQKDAARKGRTVALKGSGKAIKGRGPSVPKAAKRVTSAKRNAPTIQLVTRWEDVQKLTNPNLALQLELWRQIDDEVEKVKGKLRTKPLMLAEIKKAIDRMESDEDQDSPEEVYTSESEDEDEDEDEDE